MLVSESTNTKGLVSAVLGNAEIASLGRAPGVTGVFKIKEMADARQWFLEMGNSHWGDLDEYGRPVGFEAGFCIDWCKNNRDEYMRDLSSAWASVDDKIVKMIKTLRSEFATYHRTNRHNRKMRGLNKPAPNTLQICSHALEVMRKCKEKYYG